jgi:glycosyltransferase 2 family protein
VNPKALKNLKPALKIILSVAALSFVFWKIDLKQILEIYKSSNIFLLLLALTLFVLSKIIAAFRLNRFFLNIGIRLKESYNLKLYILGMFYNLFLPGGIGGDGYKIYLLNKQKKIKARKIFWAVLFDRLSGMLALFCLAVIISLFINIPVNFNYHTIVWLLIPIALVVFYLVLHYFFSHFSEIFISTTSMSFLVQIIQTLCAFIIFRAIGGNEQELEYLFLFLISSIVATLPITIGGIGSREITFLFGSQLLHLDQNLSIALSLIFYLITAFTSFWGIIYSINGKLLR